ncbi:hypothetical protein [Thermostaphylospora chromogena]|uniref:hypothetical protein n=1 Tax=Thermostaphylospora chromogena TaxID=35622 RepID=UPI000A5B3CE3|nr:hypothetical protein [Thermostaphylospora chromogena]
MSTSASIDVPAEFAASYGGRGAAERAWIAALPDLAAGWLDQLPTLGALTRLPSDQLTEVLEAVAAAIDAMGGGFTMRYTTVAVAAVRAVPSDPA